VPGDLVAFGTLKATALAVSPALATITTGEQQAFTATAPVTWSASTGTITADGHYSPPATVAGSQVVIITATATTATYETTPAAGDLGRAYAAVIVTQPHVQVAPLIKVFTAGDAAQQFFASAPGTAGQQTTWSLSGKVGTLASDGTYTPPDSVAMPTVVFLTGRIGTQMGQATIIVFPQFLTGIAVTPNATTPLVPGATQAFTATTKGKTADVTWTLLPEIGKITVDGHYTAPGTAQAKVTVPTPVLVVAQDRHDETSGGTAVILLAPSAG
jgi:hypothetical protein